MKENQREKSETRKRRIVRTPFAIDPASDNELLNYNSGESEGKD